MPFGIPGISSNTQQESQIALADNNQSPRQLQDSWWEKGFPLAGIDGTLWNKSFPYKLIVVTSIAGQYIPLSAWQFTLPFPPESLAISMPFATTTHVTLGGISEENNGAPIRMISFSGTTGVLPLKGAAVQRGTAGGLASIFAGTVQNVQNLASSINALVNGPPTSASNLIPSSTSFFVPPFAAGTGVFAQSTTSGYYQIRLLQQFLERYAAFKKTQAGKNCRLAWCQFKDESVYLVSPIAFELRRTAASPQEYSYSITLKAYRRVQLAIPAFIATPEILPTVRSPGTLNQILNRLQAARKVLQNARATLLGVRGDLQRSVFGPIQQMVLLTKDAISVPLAVGDLSKSVVQDLRGAVQSLVSLRSSTNGFDNLFQGAETEVAGLNNDVQQLLGNSPSQGSPVRSNLVGTSTIAGGGGTVPGPNFGRGLTQIKATAFEKVFKDPDAFPGFFGALRVDELTAISPSVKSKIDEERAKAKSLNQSDFQQIRSQIREFTLDFDNNIGAGSTILNQILNRVAVPAVKPNPTSEDLEAAQALQETLSVANTFAATDDVERLNKQKLSSIEFIAGLATKSGIAFTVPKSKFAVPFPYQSTLEQLANKYLNNPDRWLEIAALNGLQAPYIDENGFIRPLLVNGSGNYIVIDDSSNLHVGQMVTISSNFVPRTRRRIAAIDTTAPGQVLITLDGEGDLGSYTVTGGAILHSYLPNTVNSQQLIYIPSNEEPTQDGFITKDLPNVDEFDPLVQVGGVDLLLTQSGDLALTPDGDVKLAVGLTNIVQKVKLAFSVVKGTLNRHPEFGLPLQPGQSTAEVNAQDVVTAIRSMFANDPTFSEVKSVSVTKKGTGITIGASVTLAGTSHVVPISVDVL